jgi:OFA family oxalate/formate antiporter-like MFS transporter
MLMFGLIYAWSVFVLPLEREFGWNREQTSLTFAITMLFFSIGVVFGGALSDRKGPRFVCFIAGILTACGLLAASFTNFLTQLYLSYGLVCGLAIGIAYNCVISAVVRWFPDHSGAVSGVLMMGFGFGGLLLGFGANRLIETFGWRDAFRILGGLAFIVIVVFSSLLRPYKTSPSSGASSNTKMAKVTDAQDQDWRQVLKRPQFWLLWLWYVPLLSGGLATVGHVVPLAVEKGFSGDQAAYALGLFSILNGIGRVGFGFLSDRFGKKILLVDSILMVAAMLLIALIAGDFMQRGFFGFLFCVTMAGLAFGGALPQASVAVASLFGLKHFGINFGLISSCLAVGSLLGPYLGGLLRTTTGSYSLSFLFLAVLAGVGLIAGAKIVGEKE